MSSVVEIHRDLRRGWRHLPADCCPITISRHALEQANRRSFRRLDLDLAARELSLEMPAAEVSVEMPLWVRHLKAERAWLVLEGRRLAFPLTGDFIAKTCLSDAQDAPPGAEVHGDDLSVLIAR